MENTKTFKIDKGIPIPKLNNRNHELKEKISKTILKMEEGDSFFIKSSAHKRNSIACLRHIVNEVVRAINYSKSLNIRIRTLELNDGLRVFKITKNN